MSDYQREAGKRIKMWGIEGDIQRHIEGTAEYPIMYRALGTEPRTAHPFNLYGDIKSQGQALRGTFETNQHVVPQLAQKLSQFTRFNNCESVNIEKCSDKKTRPVLMRMIKQSMQN